MVWGLMASEVKILEECQYRAEALMIGVVVVALSGECEDLAAFSVSECKEVVLPAYGGGMHRDVVAVDNLAYLRILLVLFELFSDELFLLRCLLLDAQFAVWFSCCFLDPVARTLLAPLG